MVDKIDRPEAPPAYFITRPKDAKESQHEQGEQEEEKEKKYRKNIEENRWVKFGGRSMTIRPLRVAREKIRRCLFRTVALRSGVGTLQLDVIWSDGRTTRGVLVLLASLEDFIRLKKMSAGQEVPEEFWARGPTVELGIPQFIDAGGGTHEQAAPEIEAKVVLHRSYPRWLRAVGIVDRTQGRINWGIVALYFFLLVIAVIAIVTGSR